MTNTAKYLIIIFFSLVAFGAAAAGFAQNAAPNLLKTLDTGLWQLRTVGAASNAAAVDRICIADMKKLAQVQHNRLNCDQKLLKSDADTALISYSCVGHGHGLTSIRKESNQLIHIDSQGVDDGSPFSFKVEARRMGTCPR